MQQGDDPVRFGGLGQVSVEAGLGGPVAVVVVAPSGQGYCHRLPWNRKLAQAAADLVAVDVGQANVHQYRVGHVFLHGGQCRFAGVGHADPKAHHVHHFRQQVGCIAVVFHHQQARAATIGRGRFDSRRRHAFGSVVDWQFDAKGAALTGTGAGSQHAAAMQ